MEPAGDMTETPSPRLRGKRRRNWPRQADIAQRAGVSQATVSMVINDRSGTHYAIGEETRQRVWAAVEELAYVTNPAARALAGGRA
jgi:DNA-binding LacI/PurR family transcriptional regulator